MPGAPAPIPGNRRRADPPSLPPPRPLGRGGAFEGSAVTLSLASDLGPVVVTLLTGVVRAVASEHRISRVRLDGQREAVRHPGLAMAGGLRLEITRAQLAARGLAG